MKKLKKVKLNYKVNLAIEMLYIFENNLPLDFPLKGEVVDHIRAIEDLLNSVLYSTKDFYLDEIIDEEIYFVGYVYDEEEQKNGKNKFRNRVKKIKY